jgi:hypothetical protein
MKHSIWLLGAALLVGSAFLSPAIAQDTAKPGEATSAQTPEKPAAKDALAPDIKAAALWDGRRLTPFRAANFPKMVKAADADFLDDDEYVLGITLNGESRAYPTRFAAFHHVINDKLGKPEQGGEVFVTVTY